MRGIGLATALLITTVYVGGDTITVYNHTPRDLYCAIYYNPVRQPSKNEQYAIRATPLFFFESKMRQSLERPPRKIIKGSQQDRLLVFSEDIDDLKNEITAQELEALHAKNVGYLRGNKFFISDIDAQPYGYSMAEWKENQTRIAKNRRETLNQLPEFCLSTAASKPLVRKGNTLSYSEKSYRAARKLYSAEHAQSLLANFPENSSMPTVALVLLGRGYSGMLLSLGALLEAERSGVLDIITYVVGSSGAALAMGGWMQSGKSLSVYTDWITHHIQSGLKNISHDDMHLIGDHLISKYFSGQPLNSADLYGCLLANELFAAHTALKQKQTLSKQLCSKIGSLPIPIYTACLAQKNGSIENPWLEFNPFEVGASWLGWYVPTRYFGCKCKAAHVMVGAPEQNFGVLLASFNLDTAATAPCICNETALRSHVDSLFVQHLVDQIIKEQKNSKIVSSDFYNFCYKIPGCSMEKNRYLQCVASSNDFLIPYTVVSALQPERAADIVILVDSDEYTDDYNLKKLQEYTKKQGLPFPALEGTPLVKSTLLCDPNNAAAPVVIYIPLGASHKEAVTGILSAYEYAFAPQQAQAALARGMMAFADVHELCKQALTAVLKKNNG